MQLYTAIPATGRKVIFYSKVISERADDHSGRCGISKYFETTAEKEKAFIWRKKGEESTGNI